MTTADNGPRRSTPTWSVSQTETFTQCRLRWYLRHQLRLAAAHPPGNAQIMGNALHVGLAAAYAAVPERPTRRQSLWYDTGRTALAALEGYFDTEVPPRAILPAYRDDARRMLQDVLSGIPTPDRGVVLAVEEPFTFRTHGTPITGRIDLVTRTGANGIHVRDWKLGDVPHRKEELENNVQLGVYTAAARVLWPWAGVVSVGLYSISKRREISTVLAPESVTHALDCLGWDYEAAHNMWPLTVTQKLKPTPGPHCSGCEFRAYCPVTRAGTYPLNRGVDVAAGIRAVDELGHL